MNRSRSMSWDDILDDINFDEEMVDVEIAQEYLRINKEFHSIGSEDSGEIKHDFCNNKIFLSSFETLQYRSRNLSKSDITAKLMDLAGLVLENMNLLCQLDYLLRRRPIEETRDVEIKLLVQNLIYHSSLEDEIEEAGYSDSKICMLGDRPLSKLGLVTVIKKQPVTIVSSSNTAVICSVFTELCQKVGLQDYVYLVFLADDDVIENMKIEWYLTEVFLTGCVGIVTAKADIDSAINTFLYKARRYPWNIEIILVQEGVFDQFKERIEWKTKVPICEFGKTITSELCFLNNLIDNSIRIQAYGKNEELLINKLPLMPGSRKLGVSLWSSDVAESNEIAYNIKANIVWINDFGRFDGPPVASQAFYSLLYSSVEEPKSAEREINEILEKRKSWNNLYETDRYLKVWKATRTIRADIEGLKLDIVLKGFNKSTTTIGNKVCTVLRRPVLSYVKIKSLQDLLKHMNFILRGCAVFVIVEESPERDVIIKYCEELQSCGAPVAFTSVDNGFINHVRYDTKVIWSSIGYLQPYDGDGDAISSLLN